MPRHQLTYNKKLKETPEWQFLYNKWQWLRKQPHSEDFDNFPTFYEWSKVYGYATGMKLVRKDPSKPYSIKNCLWAHPETKQQELTKEDKAWIKLWNKTVNRIRKHYGMEPLPEMEAGYDP